MAKAKWVTSIKSWCRSDDQQSDSHLWLSDDKILAFRTDSVGRRYAVKVDTATGSEMPLIALNTRLLRHGHAPSFWELSPDRKWMLWIDHSLPKTWNVASLDGSKFMSYPHPGVNVDWDMTIAHWTCDSRRWGELIGDRLSLYNLKQPKAEKTVFVSEPQNVTIIFLCGFDVKGEAIAAMDGPGPTFIKFGTTSRFAPGHQLPISPGMHYLDDIELAPQGEKVAWICGARKDTPAMMQWLPRVLRPHLWDRPIEEVWVADLDGTHQHRLGYVEGYNGDLKDIRWSPDGKRLSFLHQSALYIVSAQ